MQQRMQVGAQVAAAALAALPAQAAAAGLELSSAQQVLQTGSQQLPSFPGNSQLLGGGDAGAATATVQVGA